MRPSVKSSLRSLLPGMPGSAHQLLRTVRCRAGTPSRQPSYCCLFCVEPDGLRLGRGNLARRQRMPSSAGVSRPWVTWSPQEMARISPYQLGRSLPTARLQPSRIVRTASGARRLLATHLRHSGCQPPLVDRPRHADASARPLMGPTWTRHGGSGGRWRWVGPTREPGDAVLSELQMQDTAAKVSEVCVETTVVVDTLGPARHRLLDRYLC